MTINELAESVNVSRHTYTRVEKGESDPKISLLESIALVCGVDFRWLVAGGSEEIVMSEDRCNGE
jgi:transcriptional regulator with XRE-family HTH domain